MGTPQSTDLNTDTNQIPTTGYYADPGDAAGSKWFHWFRIADGGAATIGAKADTGSTATDTTPVSVIALLKGLGTRLASIVTLLTAAAGTSLTKLEDAPHVTGDAGVLALAVRRDTASSSAGTDGDNATLNTDSVGRLRTLTKRDTTDQTTKAKTTALAASLVVKASPGTLHQITGYVASGADGWLQVHNTTSVPADTAVPDLSVFVPAASAHQPVNIPLAASPYSTGITVVWSTTGPTKTIGSAKLMVVALYD